MSQDVGHKTPTKTQKSADQKQEIDLSPVEQKHSSTSLKLPAGWVQVPPSGEPFNS